VTFPNVVGKAAFAPVYGASDFIDNLRQRGWEPGHVPRAVIFTYGGFDMVCGSQPESYTVNPMLGPGPGRFFTVTETAGEVGVCCMGIGAPAVAGQLELLVALGVGDFLSVGTAGGLGPDQSIGDVVLLNGAVRDEGVSHHYVASDADVGPDRELMVALGDGLAKAGIATSEGTTWTTDVPFRETREEIAHYRAQGVLTVEMEAAAVFAVATACEVALASAVVLDGVFGEPIDSPVMNTSAAFGRLHEVFVASIAVLAARSSRR
jgi:uridine phosphorylase